MSKNTESSRLRGQPFFPWIIRKIAPAMLIGGFVGCAIALLATRNPSLLRVLSIVAAVLFGSASTIYFYWAARPTKGGGYKWSILERVGIVVSGLAALGMASKLTFPDLLPGSGLFYLVTALILAFVIRPIFDSLGVNNNSEQNTAEQPATDSSRNLNDNFNP